jgi:hypothetical protein
MNFVPRVIKAVAYFRPFGIASCESLMNFSTLGSLQCHCEPTDAAQTRNDRRRSCRACGNAILPSEPMKLYETLSRSEIRRITQRLRRAGIDAPHVGLTSRLQSLVGLNEVESLAELCEPLV